MVLLLLLWVSWGRARDLTERRPGGTRSAQRKKQQTAEMRGEARADLRVAGRGYGSSPGHIRNYTNGHGEENP